ncbi:hypothetical protein [Wohlfahrtiimonas larvae]|uniref:hypothetical protein n=1 Tax=Wohlfahrtiimonas larvae TaxID=1157986 RepID=UPI001FE73803|nr:hypothetical protein [Wohlfahrtiimonas larvae]
MSLWYPDIWASELGGYKLIFMIVILDLGVGPLCVALSYKAYKSYKEKLLDISVITLCQLAFFSWGAWTVSISRPVYIVFDTDRFEMVVDQDIDRSKLPESGLFSALPLLRGVQMAIVDLETTVPDEEKRIEVNNDAVFGLDISKNPTYYVPYQGENIKKVLKMAKGYEYFAKNEDAKLKADAIIQKHQLADQQFKWLPIRYFSPQDQSQLFATVIINDQSAEIIDYILLDPYEI